MTVKHINSGFKGFSAAALEAAGKLNTRYVRPSAEESAARLARFRQASVKREKPLLITMDFDQEVLDIPPFLKAGDE